MLLRLIGLSALLLSIHSSTSAAEQRSHSVSYLCPKCHRIYSRKKNKSNRAECTCNSKKIEFFLFPSDVQPRKRNEICHNDPTQLHRFGTSDPLVFLAHVATHPQGT